MMSVLKGLYWFVRIVFLTLWRVLHFVFHLLTSPLHVVRVLHAHAREAAKARSPHWHAVRDQWIKAHPRCAACGSTRGIQVHHVVAFEADPSKELDTTNLISLCQRVGGPECHLMLGHGGSFRAYNPGIRRHASAVLDDRSKRKAVETKARDGRRPMHLPPDGEAAGDGAKRGRRSAAA